MRRFTKRLALCSILAATLLNEPMNGLDNRGVEDIRELLLGLKEEGKTIILASHSAEDIDVLCDTVHEMDAGVLKTVRTEKLM